MANWSHDRYEAPNSLKLGRMDAFTDSRESCVANEFAMVHVM